MIVYEKLLDYHIPDVRQLVTARDTALYALSIGLGQDPMDTAQLDFVDERRRLHSIPSHAVVVGHPGFWLSAPDTGVNAAQLVHGEQSLVVHKQMPIEGEFIGRTRVESIIDKGPGKGALLYTSKSLIDAGTGDLLATAESTTFLRGDGGFGGPSGPSRAPDPIPEKAPEHVVDLATRPEQALYYRLNGDYNPLHSDPPSAARAGFSRPILHGLCTYGITCHALLRTVCGYDPTRLRMMRLRFTAPVVPGETIRVEIWNSGAFRARTVETDAIVVNNGAFELASA